METRGAYAVFLSPPAVSAVPAVSAYNQVQSHDLTTRASERFCCGCLRFFRLIVHPCKRNANNTHTRSGRAIAGGRVCCKPKVSWKRTA